MLSKAYVSKVVVLFLFIISLPHFFFSFRCGDRYPSRGSRASRCDSLPGIYLSSFALGRPRRINTSGITLVADQLVSPPTNRRQAITDIRSWMPVFAVYALVLSASYLARVAALLMYQLVDPAHSPTIFRLGLAILGSRLRQLAASYELTDRSHLNPGLFQFHVSGSVPGERPGAIPLSRQFLQPSRFASSAVVLASPFLARRSLLVSVCALSFSPLMLLSYLFCVASAGGGA